jgi:hypothetical protein
MGLSHTVSGISAVENEWLNSIERVIWMSPTIIERVYEFKININF